MNRKNLLSGRDKKLLELAEKYESAQIAHTSIYMDADDLADLADWYAIRGKFKKAMQVTEYGLQLHPDNTALLVEQAYLLIDTQHADLAQEVAERITEDFLPEVKILKAYLLIHQSKDEEAERLIDSIEDPNDLPNIIETAYLYMDMGNLDKAREWVERGKGLYDQNESYIALTADYYSTAKQPETAEVYFNKLIDINPYSAAYWYGLARCYFDEEEYEKAIDACDYANVSDEEYGEPYLLRGHAFYQLGNDSKALENYQMAIKYETIDPNFINSFIAMEKITKGEWEEGYKYLQLAIRNVEKSIIPLELLYTNAALCLYKMGQSEKAHQYCQMAHETNPESIDAYLVEGRMYLDEGRTYEAFMQWAKAISYEPYAETWNEIGMNCIEAGHYQLAKTVLERVWMMDPNFKNINEKLTTLCLILQDKKNFKKFNALCQHPMDTQTYKHLQQALTQNGMEREQAVERILNMLTNTENEEK